VDTTGLLRAVEPAVLVGRPPKRLGQLLRTGVWVYITVSRNRRLPQPAELFQYLGENGSINPTIGYRRIEKSTPIKGVLQR
jgi:hypothetical protein